MTSPIRRFPSTILLAAFSAAFCAFLLSTPAWAQEDDPFALPEEPSAPPVVEPEFSGEPALPTDAQPAMPTDAQPAMPADSQENPREEWVLHESGIPYMSESVEIEPESAEAYHRAIQLLDEKKYVEALELLSTLALPNNVPTLELRARALAGLDRTDLALSLLEQVFRQIRTGGNSIPWPLLETRGDIYLEADLFDQAIADYTTALENSLDNPYLLSKLGTAQVRYGMNLRNTNPQASYGEFAQGVDSLERAVELGIDSAELQLHLGIAQGQLNDTEGSIESFQAASALDPENPIYHQLMGYAYMNLASQKEAADPENKAKVREDLEQAIEEFTVSLQLDPGDFSDDEEAEAAEDDLGLDLGDGDTSAEEEENDSYFDKYQPEDMYAARADAHVQMGNLLTDRSERDEQYTLAIEDADLALELNEQLPTAWIHKGVALRMLGEFEPAIDAFTEVLEMVPGNVEALLRRGIAWYYLGEHDLAVMDFEEADRLSADTRAAFWKGLALAGRGDHYDAVQSYSDVLREAPDHQMAYANRGLAYMRLGEHERAKNDFNDMIRLDQSNADAYYYRGRAYEAMGSSDQAAQSYQRALDWNPQQEAASYRLNSLDNL